MTTPNGYNIRFKNDPKIEQFFKDISGSDTVSFMGFTCYYFREMDKIDPQYLYKFHDSRGLYYNNRLSLSILSIRGSSTMNITLSVNGLMNIQKWESEFNNEVRKFVNDVILPYYRVKKYCEFKGNQLILGQVINKEKFSRHWHGYYKNYKKSILDYCEGITC